jgi:aryl carrier-like protein
VVQVVNDPDQEKNIVAYYTADKELNSNDLYKFLEERIPAYMIPRNFIRLENLPLTPEGDIDFSSLLEKGENLRELEYELPANPLEQQLLEIWKEVLMHEKIGVSDNFFKMAGNSIKATQIISRMYKMGYKISLRSLFSYPTIRELAGLLSVMAKS